MSAGVRIHAHQISAALRIIHDPVQRYLLADEVGMGKTIQAGMVMRQLLIDGSGRRRIGIIVPDALIAQWEAELRTKFHLDDFPTTEGSNPVQIVGHGDVDGWAELADVDLLVVDEAHLLARTPSPMASPYRELAEAAHRAPRVLMLSATPFSRGATTHLALLHLLDPQMFRWEDLESFERLLSPGTRSRSPCSVWTRSRTQTIRACWRSSSTRSDGRFPPTKPFKSRCSERWRCTAPRAPTPTTSTWSNSAAPSPRYEPMCPRPTDSTIGSFAIGGTSSRCRASTTKDYLRPFEFTGRTRPKVARLESLEASSGATAIAEWAHRCGAAILDHGIDPAPYGPVLAVLLSRVGGPVSDLCNLLDYRISGRESADALLPIEREALDAAPVLDFEADLLDGLRRQEATDGLERVGSGDRRRCQAPARAIVFCGRGALAEDLVAAYPLTRGS